MIHVETGRVVAYLQFTSGVEEIFAVRVLPRRRQPELLNETIDLMRHAYVLPEESMSEVFRPTGPRPRERPTPS